MNVESTKGNPDENLENAKSLLLQNEQLKHEIRELIQEFNIEVEEIVEPKLQNLNIYFANLKSVPDIILKKIQAISKLILQKHDAFIDNFIKLQHFKSDNSANTDKEHLDLIVEINLISFPDISNLGFLKLLSDNPSSLPAKIQSKREGALKLQASYFARETIKQLIIQNKNFFDPLRCGESEVIQLGARIYQLDDNNSEFLQAINRFEFINTPNDLYDHIHLVLTSLIEEGQRPVLKFRNRVIDDPYSESQKIAVPVLKIYTDQGFSKTFDFSDYFIPRLYSYKSHSFETTQLFDSYDKGKAKKEIKIQLRNFKQMNFSKDLTKDFGQKIEPLSKMPSSFYSRLFKNNRLDDIKVLNKLKGHIMSLQMEDADKITLSRSLAIEEPMHLTDAELIDLQSKIEDINLDDMSFVMDPNGNIIDIDQLPQEEIERNLHIKEDLENIKIDLSKMVGKLIEIN